MTKLTHKKGISTVLIISLLLSLSGCIKEVNDDALSFDLAINTEKELVSTYKAKHKSPYPYYDRFAEILLEGSPVVQQDQSDEFDFLDVCTADGRNLHLSIAGGAHFRTQGYSYIEGVFKYEEQLYAPVDNNTEPLIEDDKLHYSKDMDLPFKARTAAEQEVMDQLAFYYGQEYTLSVAETFVLDHQSMSARENDKQAKGLMVDQKTGQATGKGQWSAADDCYYIVLTVSLDGIPMLAEDYLPSVNLYYQGIRVEACYGEEGFRYLFIPPLYDMTLDQSGVAAISAAEALDYVKRKFDSMIVTGEMTVTSLELRYMVCCEPYSETKMRPIVIWRAELCSSDGNSSTILYFDALTGIEVL